MTPDDSRRREIYVPPGGPGRLPALSPEIYQAMGTDGVFAMLEAFYQELGRSSIRHIFSDDLAAASRRSAAFYVQLLGGPSMYNETYGNPMMRARHMPFEIDEASRQIWVECFLRTLERSEEFGFPAEHLESFKSWLHGFSRWMVNTKSD